MQVNAASGQRHRMPQIEQGCDLTCFSFGLLCRPETGGQPWR